MLNGRTCENLEVFKTFFYNSMEEIYGTHDWIADRAIGILFDHFPDDFLLKSIFYNYYHMRVYYLYGIELPDTMANPLKSIDITTDFGNTFKRKDFYINHSVALRQDGTINKYQNDKNIFRSARKILKVFFNNTKFRNDYQAIALYLGYISHLIGDACYIHHIYKNPNKSIEQQSKGEILQRTRNPPEDKNWSYNSSLIDIELARNEFKNQSENIEDILLYCIWHCFFGKAHRIGAFQDIIVPDWNWYKDIKIKEIDKIREFNTYKKWWNGVNFHLNLAVFYTAVAINEL